MTTTLDGFGKACPMPLMMAKKEIDGGCHDVAVKVDNETAVKNISRLGKREHLAVEVSAIEGGWLVHLFEGEGASDDEAAAALGSADAPAYATSIGSGYSVFVGKDHVGEGDPELGHNLMKMALYTLSEGDQVPISVLFMNSGVKLVTEDSAEIVESVKKMQDRGTEILVCGTCLNFYGLTDSLAVGEVSNMYDILERMQEAQKVISL